MLADARGRFVRGCLTAGQARWGQGNLRLEYPPKLEIWNRLLQGQAAATWIFLGWEGAQAKLANVALRTFSLEEYGIPYGYTPVLVSVPAVLATKRPAIARFLQVSGEGYRQAVADPALAAQQLAQTGLPDFADVPLVQTSLELLQPHFLTESGNWGTMDAQKWIAFVTWLETTGLLVPTADTTPDKLFVNVLLAS